MKWTTTNVIATRMKDFLAARKARQNQAAVRSVCELLVERERGETVLLAAWTLHSLVELHSKCSMCCCDAAARLHKTAILVYVTADPIKCDSSS